MKGRRPTYGTEVDGRLVTRGCSIPPAARRTHRDPYRRSRRAAAPTAAARAQTAGAESPTTGSVVVQHAARRGSQLASQVLEDDPQIPVAQAVAEEEEAAGAGILVELRRHGRARIARHPREELDVVLFGDHVVVERFVLRPDRAVHLVDHAAIVEIEIERVGLDILRARPIRFDIEQRVEVVARIGGIDDAGRRACRRRETPVRAACRSW